MTAAQLVPLTSGPDYHWFGYYDKFQTDPTDRYVLGLAAGFESRGPRRDDEIRVGMVDTADDHRWIDLAGTWAWCWQQGCMLQWLPGSDDEIIFNDREGDRFVSRILNVDSGASRTLSSAIYTISPDARWALSLDFERTGRLRPGYGYVGVDEPDADEPAPADRGIYRVDLQSGRRERIISLAGLVGIDTYRPEMRRAPNWVNHLLPSPSGERFIFLHRWASPGEGWGAHTRMFTARPDGGELRLVDPYGRASHFIWRDDRTILVWANRPEAGFAFYLIDEPTGAAEPIGTDAMTADGHCSFLPGGRWILNDGYAEGGSRRTLYLYDTADRRRVELAEVASPPSYAGELRCDLHPRRTRDGRRAIIDSVHEGGRQMYMIDLAGPAGLDEP